MILVDGGPLAALVDASDPGHAACVGVLKELRVPLGTVWPALEQALARLQGVPEGQRAVLEMVRRGAVRLVDVGAEDVPRLKELLWRYRDRRMPLAHACLVRVAEREGLDTVLTLDAADFAAYRIGGRKAFRVLPARTARRRG